MNSVNGGSEGNVSQIELLVGPLVKLRGDGTRP
jgi:hypothetical protein